MFKSMLGRRRSMQRAVQTPADISAGLRRQIPDITQQELELVLAGSETTMTSPERIVGLIRAVEYVVHSGLPGDIVECGVWRGGSMWIAARTLLQRDDATRDLWLYDTFEGMSEPTAADVDFTGHSAAGLLQIHDPEDRNGVWCLSRLDEVKKTMASSGYPAERVRYVTGKVEDTLSIHRPAQIALLRLDTDWYESTRCELEWLFPCLVPGGVLIVDDYGHWQGCRRAVDEYFAITGQRIHLARMDYTGRIGIKQDMGQGH